MDWNYEKINPQTSITFPEEKPIEDSEDKRLSEYIAQQKLKLTDVEKVFVYFAVGSANGHANRTTDSGDIDENKLKMQQYPKELLDYVKSKGYTPILINIDEFNEPHFKDKPEYFNGLFPLSGYTKNPKNESNSLAHIADFFDTVINSGGFVVLLNAVADMSETATNPGIQDGDEENAGKHPTFYLFSGMERIMLRMDNAIAKASFVYVSSFLGERDYYNLYRPTTLTNGKQEFVGKLCQTEINLSDLIS